MSGWDRTAFVAALQEADGRSASAPFIEAVDDAVLRAREHWADIPLPPDFELFLAERMPPTVDPGPSSVPIDVRALYFTCACLSGDPRATHRLGAMLREAAAPAFAHIRLDPATADDVSQQVLERLLVPEAGAKLAAYSGRGPLRAWLRSTALRQALKATRRRAPVEDDADMAAMLVAAPLEGDYFREHYGSQFRSALRLAFGELTPRERGLLRQHYLDGLTLLQLARIHGVDRSTVARWLGAARARLVAQTRRIAAREHGVPRDEFDSLLRRVWSQLRPDLRELLASMPGDADRSR